jgi:hypothetical protein
VNFIQTKVSLSMGLGHGGSGPRWRLEVNDEVSGLRLLSLTLTAEEFGKALGAFYTTQLTGEVPSPDLYAARIGKRHDVKVVNVPIGAAHGDEALAAATEAAQPYLVDGWILSEMATYNTHRRDGPPNDATYSVTLDRWVDPSTPKEPAPEKPAKVGKPKGKTKKK